MKTVRDLRISTFEGESELTAERVAGPRSTQQRQISRPFYQLRAEGQGQKTSELPAAERRPTGWLNSGQSAADHDSHWMPVGLHSGKFWSERSCFSGRKRGEWRSTLKRARVTPSIRRLASTTLTWTCLLLCIVQCVGTATVTTTDGMAGVRIFTRMAHGRLLPLVEPLTDEAEYIPKKCLGLPLLGMATECCQEGHTRGTVTGWTCGSLSNEEREYLEHWLMYPRVLNYKKDEQSRKSRRRIT